MPKTFQIVDDRTGETKDATIEKFADYQVQGYRIADVGAYESARFEAAQPPPAPIPNAGEQSMFAQGNQDAALMAGRQYPDAKPEGDDAKTLADAQAKAAADEKATKQPDEGNFDAPDAAVDGPKPVVVKRAKA